MTIDIGGAKKAHTRGLEINTYEGDKDTILVEGILKDDCFVTRYRASGRKVPPGTIHHMAVRMKLKRSDLTIEEIEADMHTVPHKDCRKTIDVLQSLVGMRVASGITLKVKKIMGGTRGCAHLTSLVLAMTPAVVQGSWSVVSQSPLDPSIHADRAVNFLTDTCWVWRKGGPLERDYQEQLKDYPESR